MAPSLLRFRLPGYEDDPRDVGADLPPALFARVTLVRDVANGLLPQPLALEGALARGEHARMREYLGLLHPLFQRGQRFEGEIVDAHDCGHRALATLARRRAHAWNDFLNDAAEFEERTRDLRAPLGIGLDPGVTLLAYERILARRGGAVPDAELPARPLLAQRRSSATEVAVRAQRARELEDAIALLDVRVLDARAAVAQPLARSCTEAGAPAVRDWAALHPQEQLLPTVAAVRAPQPVDDGRRERAAQLPVLVPCGAPTSVPSVTAKPEAPSLEVLRRSVLRVIERQAWSGGILGRRAFRNALAAYEGSAAERVAALPPEQQRAFFRHEAGVLLASFGRPQERERSLEAVLRSAGEQWRRMPLLARIGIGVGCAAAGAAGGTAALLGAGVAAGGRLAGAYVVVDALWQRAEAAVVSRHVRRSGDLQSFGAVAWRMARACARPSEQSVEAARALSAHVRSDLTEAAGLRALLEGASASARTRPLHVLGKLALAAGITIAASSEAVRSIVGSVRESLHDLFAHAGAPPDVRVPQGSAPASPPSFPQPAPPTAPAPLTPSRLSLPSLHVDPPPALPGVALPHASAVELRSSLKAAPQVLHLVAEAAPGPDGVERLLRTCVLAEMAEYGTNLDQLGRLDGARALNATANLARRLQLGGELRVEERIDVPVDALREEVQRSLARPSLPGAELFVDRVDWPRWVAAAREEARTLPPDGGS